MQGDTVISDSNEDDGWGSDTSVDDAGDLNDLDSAIQKLKEVVDLVPPDHPDRPEWLQQLATCFSDRYRRMGDLKDLTAAVKRDEEAVDWTPEGHPERASRLQALAVSFRDQYQRLGELNDLKAALQRAQESVDLTPAGHPERASRLQVLAVFLRDRYQRLGDLEDLTTAVKRNEEAVDCTPEDHPDKPGHLKSLAVSFRDRYQRLGELKDLETALQRAQESVDLTPAGHPERASRLQALAVCFTDRYRRLGGLNDLETALQRDQESVDLTPAGHPDRPNRLQGLAMSYRDRYQRLGELKDLEAALQRDQESVDLTLANHPDTASQLQDLALSFRDRYQRLGELKDLEAALQRAQESRLGELKDLEAVLQKAQESVDLTPADHPHRAGRLQGLATSFRDQYQRLGELKNLEAALQRAQESVDLTPAGHPDRASRLQALAASFRDRYQRLGELADLETALQRDQESVDLTPEDHPDRESRLQTLAVSFRDRYQRLGELADLEAALQRDQESVDLIPENHPDRASRLQGLAASFRNQYQRLGELKDLEAALQRDQESVDLTPANHPDRASRLQGLALSSRAQYQRLGELKNLEAALQRAQESVDLTPASHSDRASRLEVLAASFRDRYQRLGELKDLEVALQHKQQAVDLTPAGHPERASRLQALAVSFIDRYQRLGDLEDLTTAVKRDEEAVVWTPENHPARASRLQNLAVSFSNQFVKFKKPEDLKILGCDPEPSWWAALRWASLSQEFQPEYCSAAYLAAFNLLPELLWLGHTIPVRQDAIHRLDIGKTVSTATRISLTLCNLISAIEFFEQGLAITFQQMLQLKPDLNILPPQYAQNLQKLSSELYSGTSDNPSRVARERQELLQAIRKLPGFEHFLLPQPYKILCRASQGGPVVILNSHENGCDGIIILNPMSDPVHVPLSNVTLHLLKLHQDDLKELLSYCNVRTRGESVSTRVFGGREGFRSRNIEEHFTDLLIWLWNNVVEPIYQALASHDIHKGRLWWLPSGSFTGLPLHACPPTDQFIHSYTATLGSLLAAQAKKPSITQQKVGVVGVTHTGLHGENYLKGVEQEVQKIFSVIKDPSLEYLKGEQATPAAVQNQLQTCSWVHLACHGTQDVIEPTKSRLLLYNGVLELETILKMPLSNAEFVFLAACQTAMGDAVLVNESFHLGGGFIAAGFRGAIGTLWSMNDQDGPVVAETVYSHLFRDGRQPQASDAAEALQLAVNKLKTQKVGMKPKLSQAVSPTQQWLRRRYMGMTVCLHQFPTCLSIIKAILFPKHIWLLESIFLAPGSILLVVELPIDQPSPFGAANNFAVGDGRGLHSQTKSYHVRFCLIAELDTAEKLPWYPFGTELDFLIEVVQGVATGPLPFRCRLTPRTLEKAEIISREFLEAGDIFVKFEFGLSVEDKEYVSQLWAHIY
ncbi:CHAT domain-containing protein [Mycena maculata]|uniref:CHAT domain-containing protein n=1 Tax=Mycena maculata TaxID=230809 RepID=A0AAD7ILK9_9AGAR|nr:CHAT domain-containing protein [Mycena maculata]